VCNAHLVIVGGGASGVELAGELAIHGRKMMKSHGLDPGLLTIDLIEAAPRLLPALPPEISERVFAHLGHLGVNVFLDRALVKETVEGVYLKDMQMRTKTVIWTAGVAVNSLYKKIPGLSFDQKGRVKVDEYLEADGVPGVFIAGDAASTKYSGMAQTALTDGSYLAYLMSRRVRAEKAAPYAPVPVAYAIPAGPHWAAVLWHGMHFYGRIGWLLRRAADLRFFLSILPLRKALQVFRNAKLSGACEVCAEL
jgi:NADH:ubiquinone reductase (H+-translocating)